MTAVRLVTPRLTLVPLTAEAGAGDRPLTPRDEDAAAEHAAARAWLAARDRRPGPAAAAAAVWAVALRDSRSFVGAVELAAPADPCDSAPPFAPSGDAWPLLFADILPEYQDRGFTTEAVKAVLLHVCKEDSMGPRIQSILPSSHPRRSSAENLLERLGFRLITEITPSLKRDGKLQDSWSIWELERVEFLELWSS
ncbi:hypothetical protein BDR26DRAFT_1012448 [Obelidium mucronatum]|nr:hypothetical protein BDR26DRAFT_1012448 [Obelidium mucronatum]